VTDAPLYDRIGRAYAPARRPDPRIAARITAALGAARTVVNVGAGAGSYEPEGRAVVAVDPSPVMLAQRPGSSAPAVRGVAEALPFPDRSFDVALATLTLHHWSNLAGGLAELRRVAERAVVFTFDIDHERDAWIVSDYLPAMTGQTQFHFPPIDHVVELLDARVEIVPVPADCTDGFTGAYWARPEAYLDPAVRAGMSAIQTMEPDVVAAGLRRLRDDLASGAWEERWGHLRGLPELDLGYRLLVSR